MESAASWQRPRVYVRLRPASEESGAAELSTEGSRISYPSGKRGKREEITVDRVFNSGETQDVVFTEVGLPMLRFVLQGYRGCVLAYGITGAGKTYTMHGDGLGSDGLVQRVVREAFAAGKPELKVEMQAVQLHRERYEDLGMEEPAAIKVLSTLHRDSTTATTSDFGDVAAAEAWLRAVLQRRATAANRQNKASSRSHFLLRLGLRFREGGEERRGVLDLVDLAGSERLGEDLSGEAYKDHVTIQAELANLEHCIESKIRNAALAPQQQKLVPFTHKPLPRLLAPDFGGGAALSMVLACPARGRGEEAGRTLDFARTFLRLALRAKAEGVSVTSRAEDMVRGADAEKKEKVEAPEAAAPSLERGEEEEGLAQELQLRGQRLEQRMAEEEAKLFLASKVQRQGQALRDPEEGDLTKLLQKGKKLLESVGRWHPEMAGLLQPLQALAEGGPAARAELGEGFQALAGAVAEREAELRAMARWQAELEALKGEELSGLQGRQLQVLKEVLGEVRGSRKKLSEALDGWLQLWRDLAAERQELSELEGRVGLLARPEASTQQNLDLQVPLQETLEADLASWSESAGELRRAIQELPSSATELWHLLQARPAWLRPFHELGGAERMLEGMEATRKPYWHIKLADGLEGVLDLELFAEERRPALRRRFVEQFLRVMRPQGDWEQLTRESEEGSISAYLKYMRTLAREPAARRSLVEQRAVPLALSFLGHNSQDVEAQAWKALGQVAAEEQELEEEELKYLLATVAGQGSAQLRLAAAQCLQRLCCGSGSVVQSTQKALEKLEAAQLLMRLAKKLEESPRGDLQRIGEHARYATLLLLDGRPAAADTALDAGHRSFVLRGLASAAAASCRRETELQGVAASVQHWGQVRTGAWVSSAGSGTAGGSQQSSTFWMNPMYVLRFKAAAPGQRPVALAATVANPSQNGGEHGGRRRSTFYSMWIVSMKEAGDESLREVLGKGLNLPLSGVNGHRPTSVTDRKTSLYLDDVDAADEYLVVLYLTTALLEQHYVVSVVADLPFELLPLSPQEWQRRTFIGAWRGREVPAQSSQGADLLWRSYPQLQLSNESSAALNVCCILSYAAQDEAEMEEHKAHEEDEQKEGAKPLPYLDLRLHELGEQPLHRCVSSAAASARIKKVSNRWVALHARLEPGSAHCLVPGRTMVLKAADRPVEAAPEAQSFRLQLLADGPGLRAQPCGLEWHHFSTAPLRCSDLKSLRFRLSLPCGQQPQHLQLLLSTAGEVWKRMEVTGGDCRVVDCTGKPGVFCSLLQGEYELRSGEDWEVLVSFHSESKAPFLLCLHGFSYPRPGQWGDLPQGCEQHCEGKDAAELQWLQAQCLELPCPRRPQSREELQAEAAPFPPRATGSAAEETVSVSRAYLQRLFALAQRGAHKKPSLPKGPRPASGRRTSKRPAGRVAAEAT